MKGYRWRDGGRTLEVTVRRGERFVPPFDLHRAFVGQSGEFRAGPIVDEFEALYGDLVRRTSKARLARASRRVDRFVHGEALALFLCAPQALYAVNEHVEFKPYRTTFELSECRVGEGHWSRRRGRG
jgi:peptide/nickel transport system substrate-binding protein